MLGAWPEPFGLVAIESLATGAPVLGRRAGALLEIVEHDVDGYLVDDLREAELAVKLLPGLDRARIRARALARFGADRMVAEYEEIDRRLIHDHVRGRLRTGHPEGRGSPRGDARPLDGTCSVDADLAPQSARTIAVGPGVGRDGGGRS
jgi:hypothetical protein